jgi:hypothetical protein
MKSCEQVRSQLLEHLYDLLEGEDGHALADHLDQCNNCQTELKHAREQMALIAEAAKQEFPHVHFIPPADEVDTAARAARPSRFRFRWAVAAAVLLAVAGLGVPTTLYWAQQAQVTHAENALQQAKDQLARADAHRGRILDQAAHVKADFQRHLERADKDALVARDDLVQLGQDVLEKIQRTNAEVHAKQMDLTVIGPRLLEPGAANSFRIQTRSFRLQPMPARITVAIRDQNQRELFKKEAIASRGDLVVNLPRDLPVKSDTALTLEVQAQAEQNPQVIISQTLPLTGSLYITHLATDKPLYQPGETIRFKSLTLERFGLRPPSEDLELTYQITKPTGEVATILKCLAAARRAAADGPPAPVIGPDKNPIRGVGAGEYVIDRNAPAGQYTLTVSESHQRFPPQEHKFQIARSEKSQPKDANAAPSLPSPAKEKSLTVEFFPEGGNLVAGLPNRVYYRASTASNQPVEMKGHIVDETGKTVSAVETFRDPAHPGSSQGLGVFTFTPQSGKEYQLKVQQPADIDGKFFLPAVKSDGVVLSIPAEGSTDKQTIKAVIGNVGRDRALLVGAYSRGRMISQQPVDVKSGEVKEVMLGPENGVGGVYRVTVFERMPDQARGERLEPRAERLIYRPPAGRLRLTIQPDKASYQPGDRARIRIAAANQNGQPQPAIALVAVTDQAMLKLANEKPYWSMPAHFLLATEVDRTEDLDNADFLLSADPQAAQALDLLLGTQGWRRFAEQDPEKFLKEKKQEAQRLLALQGQWPPRSVNYGQEAVQKVVKEFHNRYAELERGLTQAEEKQLLARKGIAEKEKLQRLREEAKEEETERIVAIGRVKDAQESLTVTMGKFESYRELFKSAILPGLLIVFLLATLANLIAAILRSRQGKAIPYLAGAACSLLLVGLALTERANLRQDLTGERGAEIAILGPIEIESPFVWIGPVEKQPEKVSQPAGPMIAPVRPVIPQPADQKEKVPEKSRQGATKTAPQAMPVIPLHPGPAKENRKEAAVPEPSIKKDRSHLLPRLPLPPPSPPPFIVREYAHVHLHGEGKAPADFAETLYWHPVLVMPDGTAEISFDLTDSATTYQILVAAHTLDGRLAETTAELTVVQPKNRER